MSLTNYISAARPKTLPLAVAGPLIAIAIAIFEKGSISVLTAVLTILTAILLQILSNFANDLGDFQKGTDQAANRTDRALASGKISEKSMKWAIAYLTLFALITGICLLVVSINNWQEGLVLFVIGLAAIVAAITYTVGKKAYGYSGFGDVFVFVFFGLVSVVATYFVLTKNYNYPIWVAAVAMGCFSTLVLNINNVRDLEKDKLANKNTIPVYLGFAKSRIYHICLAGIASILMLNLLVHYNTPLLGLALFALLFILHQFLELTQNQYEEYNKQLKYTSLTILLIAVTFFGYSMFYYFSI